jgi:Na+/H+ antiporter NhaD/arsenite permease-like protein
MSPLILSLTRRLRRPPIPYLIGLATAANIGSAATITGNPQNIIIGTLSQIPYGRFAARLAPISMVGLLIDFALIALVYSRSLSLSTWPTADESELPGPAVTEPPLEPVRHIHRGLLIKSLAVSFSMVALFFAGQPIALVALAAAAILLLDKVRPEKVYRMVDWPLLVLFVGLFIVVHAFEVHVVRTWDLDQWTALTRSPVVLVSALSVALSNLVSNVPAVLLFRPLMEAMEQKELAWLALAMSSTLAGNLTILGSIANLIVAETARREGVSLSFGEFLKVGVPLTILTTLAGVGWLLWTSS